MCLQRWIRKTAHTGFPVNFVCCKTIQLENSTRNPPIPLLASLHDQQRQTVDLLRACVYKPNGAPAEYGGHVGRLLDRDRVLGNMENDSLRCGSKTLRHRRLPTSSSLLLPLLARILARHVCSVDRLESARFRLQVIPASIEPQNPPRLLWLCDTLELKAQVFYRYSSQTSTKQEELFWHLFCSVEFWWGCPSLNAAPAWFVLDSYICVSDKSRSSGRDWLSLADVIWKHVIALTNSVLSVLQKLL